MNKQHYFDLGVLHASDGRQARRYDSSSQTWQAKAYWEGIRSVATSQTGALRPTGKSMLQTMPAEELQKMGITRLPLSGDKNSIKGVAAKLIAVDEMNHDSIINTIGWPQAAAEHVLVLTREINAERNDARRTRLFRALDRMQKRHGVAA